MDPYADFPRDQAADFRRLAEMTNDAGVKTEMLELAPICDEIAAEMEDDLPGG
jgi:hypothetical protein